LKVKGNVVVAVFFLLLGIYGAVQSLAFNHWESIILPAGTSFAILSMAAIEVFRELRLRNKRGKQTEAFLETEDENRIRLSQIGLIVGWAAGFTVGVYLLGFRITIPVFALSYLKWRGRSWVTAILFAFIALALLWGGFEIGLKAPLYEGLVFGAR
jgi:4-hydroxybenzoate polyprenyltransferase